jgi:hypothetical protein
MTQAYEAYQRMTLPTNCKKLYNQIPEKQRAKHRDQAIARCQGHR